ncbi:glutamate racemase [Desulfoplanes formicivorans]|uniref:Glutamate racemase n=1 Tax=Desulfoplanes formicivorans TaxID=1592317 RepID=A0A194AF14_9BACT|nr:glutamate racemase [Desulfoplanes formicivorans]GAU07923.1 glutamate racemase [Desulfoplanes formicivorans]
MTPVHTHLPIGVFDSGVGGLTVLKALRHQLPHENLIYLGDTARLPYGTKSPDTITRYALQVAAKLISQQIKLLVVACNTVSSVALADLALQCAPVPVIGVVKPGAQAACRATRNRQIAVMGTESTISRGAYQQAIHAIDPNATVLSTSCTLFVALAEEGWLTGSIVESVAKRYLDDLLANHPGTSPDCLVLGCTHFPLLAPAIARVAGPTMTLVDSASTTAVEVANILKGQNLCTISRQPGSTRFLATDSASRFARVGSIFLQQPLTSRDVEIVDL